VGASRTEKPPLRPEQTTQWASPIMSRGTSFRRQGDIRHAGRRAGTGQDNSLPRDLEPDFRIETAAGPRRTRVLR
jgi:hypothetical protein